ncbi:MAG: putative PEP-binding protein [Candidatus Margulisiibacteriota bacterium]
MYNKTYFKTKIIAQLTAQVKLSGNIDQAQPEMVLPVQECLLPGIAIDLAFKIKNPLESIYDKDNPENITQNIKLELEKLDNVLKIINSDNFEHIFNLKGNQLKDISYHLISNILVGHGSGNKVINIIKNDQYTCEAALGKVFATYLPRLEYDIAIVEVMKGCMNVLAELLAPEKVQGITTQINKVEGKCVLIADELTAPEINVSLFKEKVSGIIIAKNYQGKGRPSHLVVVCEELGIPLFLCSPEEINAIKTGDHIIMKCLTGDKEAAVIKNPQKETTAGYHNIVEEEDKIKRVYHQLAQTHAITKDDVRVKVGTNIESTGSILEMKNQISDVTLFRTEFLYFNRTRMLNESEVTDIISTACENTSRIEGGKARITIRMPDFSYDKISNVKNLPPQLQSVIEDMNEKDGQALEGTAFLLDDRVKEILTKPFIKGVLRGSRKNHNADLIIPNWYTLEQWDMFRALVQECIDELEEAQVKYNKDLLLGVMIENKESFEIMQNKENLRHVKKISIGTNDLECAVASQAELFYIIQKTASIALWNNISCSMCGRKASDPKAVLALLGLIGKSGDGKSFSLEFGTVEAKIGEVKTIIMKNDIGKLQTNELMVHLFMMLSNINNLPDDTVFNNVLDQLYEAYKN